MCTLQNTRLRYFESRILQNLLFPIPSLWMVWYRLCKSSLVSPAGILKILPVGSLSHAAFMYAAMKPSQIRPKFVKYITLQYQYMYTIMLTSTVIDIFILKIRHMSNSTPNSICPDPWSPDIKVISVFLNSSFGSCKCWYGYAKHSLREEMS